MTSQVKVNINPLHKNFLSSGAMDHPIFWIHGASNFIPNMMKFIERVNTPKLVDISEFANDKSNLARDLIMKHGSDKHFHNSHILYSYILNPDKEMNILEIGMGTRNPNIPSTMYFYEEDKQFVNTPGGSLRFFKEYCPLSNVYGADIDRDILFTEDRIQTSFVDQLDTESLKSLFGDRMFDLIVDDGLHHVSSNMNTLLEAISHINIDGYIVIEDIINTENWYVIDFVVSKIPGFETKLIDLGTNVYIYLVKRMS